MSGLWERITREPALLVGLVTAALVVLVEFGVPITDGQQTALQGLVIAVGALITRQAVTPNVSVGAKTDDLESDGNALVSGPAADLPNDIPVNVTPKDEYGHGTGNTLITVAAVLVIIVCVVLLLRWLV